MNRIESTKGTEVAVLRGKVRRVVDCVSCATGIAIEMVRRHWEPDGDPHDWKLAAQGHECAATKGLTPSQDAQLQAIERAYGGDSAAA